MNLADNDKKAIVLRWYDEASLNGNAEAAEAWLDGVFFALGIGGMTIGEAGRLKNELRDLLDSYIDGEWEDDVIG